MRTMVGIAPQVAFTRTTLREFADNARFAFVVVTGPGSRFVQFSKGTEHDGLRGEVVGSEYLPADAPFGPIVEVNLQALGWVRPGRQDEVRNWWMEWDPGWVLLEVETLTVATLLALGVLRDPLLAYLGNEDMEETRAAQPGPC